MTTLAPATPAAPETLPQTIDQVIDRLNGILDDALRQSGHYGPRVVVPHDADVQTKLLAFIGRTP